MSARNADRRTPRSAALRRLIAAGNLLAAAARGETRATPELADAWDNSVDALRADLAEPRAVTDPRTRGMPPIETIGTCEMCGATDHHLILGTCPTCAAKAAPRTIDCKICCEDLLCTHPIQVANEMMLGAEADVQHTYAARADSDGTGYCRGCGVTIGEPHHPGCDLAPRRKA